MSINHEDLGVWMKADGAGLSRAPSSVSASFTGLPYCAWLVLPRVNKMTSTRSGKYHLPIILVVYSTCVALLLDESLLLSGAYRFVTYNQGDSAIDLASANF